MTFLTVSFWVIFSIGLILMFYFINSKDEGDGVGATITFILSAILLYATSGHRDSFISFITNNWLRNFEIVMIYLIIGLVWSFVKWYFYLLNKKEKLEDLITMNSNYELNQYDIPKAGENKDKIILWMSYWPWSAIWTIINDPVRKIFNWIYTKFSSIYQKMSDKIFADFNKKVKMNEIKKQQEIDKRTQIVENERKNRKNS
jgi:hypothetical protein